MRALMVLVLVAVMGSACAMPMRQDRYDDDRRGRNSADAGLTDEEEETPDAGDGEETPDAGDGEEETPDGGETEEPEPEPDPLETGETVIERAGLNKLAVAFDLQGEHEVPYLMPVTYTARIGEGEDITAFPKSYSNIESLSMYDPMGGDIPFEVRNCSDATYQVHAAVFVSDLRDSLEFSAYYIFSEWMHIPAKSVWTATYVHFEDIGYTHTRIWVTEGNPPTPLTEAELADCP